MRSGTFAELQGCQGEEWTHANGVTNVSTEGVSPTHTVRSRQDMPGGDPLRCTKMNCPSWHNIIQTRWGRPQDKGLRPLKAGCLRVYACGSWSGGRDSHTGLFPGAHHAPIEARLTLVVGVGC